MLYLFAVECPAGYELTKEYGSANKICGSQRDGSVGEIGVGGPKWPTATSTPAESRQACADACNNRAGCTHLIWFEDLGCRTQTNCDAAVDGHSHTKSTICKRSSGIDIDQNCNQVCIKLTCIYICINSNMYVYI